MKILVVAATHSEIEPLHSYLEKSGSKTSFEINGHQIDILMSGVGMVATAFCMGRHLAKNSYDLAINLGICGSFDFDLNLGEVVLITEDVFAEQGAEDGDEFISIDKLGFGKASQISQTEIKLILPTLEKLKKVKAITVNKVHGNELSISKTLSHINASVESMEGAAFFYACNQNQLPSLQIRAISNFVERRNREKWNIGKAIKNLNSFAFELFESIPK
ncbi:futalosine hydrolase [Daejeonella oryzae]|uniref:futalosine hydrolase n=1 Tax=Daejeonella oryzae TaxID=1122943 RepID=UPI0004204BEC|nr:futalosine hydrolase [Daejeonella oryzae]